MYCVSLNKDNKDMCNLYTRLYLEEIREKGFVEDFVEYPCTLSCKVDSVSLNIPSNIRGIKRPFIDFKLKVFKISSVGEKFFDESESIKFIDDNEMNIKHIYYLKDDDIVKFIENGLYSNENFGNLLSGLLKDEVYLLEDKIKLKNYNLNFNDSYFKLCFTYDCIICDDLDKDKYTNVDEVIHENIIHINTFSNNYSPINADEFDTSFVNIHNKLDLGMLEKVDISEEKEDLKEIENVEIKNKVVFEEDNISEVIRTKKEELKKNKKDTSYDFNTEDFLSDFMSDTNIGDEYEFESDANITEDDFEL